MKRTVSDLMKQKDLSQLHLINDNSNIKDALLLLQKDDVGALLVVNDGRVVGVFSERDFARTHALQIGQLDPSIKVRNLMSKKVVYVTPEYTLDECMTVMVKLKIRHLPVLKGEIPVAFLSMRHIMEALVEENQFLVNQLITYITGSTVNEPTAMRSGLIKHSEHPNSHDLLSEI